MKVKSLALGPNTGSLAVLRSELPTFISIAAKLCAEIPLPLITTKAFEAAHSFLHIFSSCSVVLNSSGLGLHPNVLLATDNSALLMNAMANIKWKRKCVLAAHPLCEKPLCEHIRSLLIFHTYEVFSGLSMPLMARMIQLFFSWPSVFKNAWMAATSLWIIIGFLPPSHPHFDKVLN